MLHCSDYTRKVKGFINSLEDDDVVSPSCSDFFIMRYTAGRRQRSIAD